MPLILGTNSIKDTGYDVANSCRFNGTNDSLNLTTGTPTDAKKFTFSTWLKKCKNGVEQDLMAYNPSGNAESMIRIDDSDRFVINDRDASDTDVEFFLVSNAVLRDASAWYNLIVAVDTTDGTNTNRVKMYINGTQVTSLQTATYPEQNITPEISAGSRAVYVGARVTSQFFNGYLAETVFIDGQQLAADSFGEFDSDSGIWKPIDVSGLTFGDNGFYFEYSDSSDLGVNSKGTDWTPNNLAAIDQSTDTCTNNFSTINSLDNFYAGATLSEGNLRVVTPVAAYAPIRSTIGVSSGKWYAEVKIITASATDHEQGVVSQAAASASAGVGRIAEGYGYAGNGQVFRNDSQVTYSANSLAADDILGIYLDLDNNKLYFAKNGTIQNSGAGISIVDPASTTDGVYYFATSDNANLSGGSYQFDWNFGNPIFTGTDQADANGYGSFEYSPSAGTFDSASKDFYALNTKNLAEYG